MQRFNTRQEQGFGLLEVLVTIAIIGILAAIAVPIYLSQKNEAYAAAVKSDLSGAALVLHQDYLKNNDGEQFVTDGQSLKEYPQSFPAATTFSDETVMVLRLSEDNTDACLVGYVEHNGDEYGTGTGKVGRWVYDLSTLALVDSESVTLECNDAGSPEWKTVDTHS